MGIHLRQPVVLLPRGGVGRLCHPGLAHHVVVGVFLVDSLHPPGHGILESVRVSVHADAVDADCLNPPDGVLNQIAQHVWIVLVKVGHRRHKPTLRCFVQVYLRGIKVAYGC